MRARALPHHCNHPQLHAATSWVLWCCWCGQWWRTVTVNDVFTGGPLYTWARVGWWDFRARRRIRAMKRGAR